MIRIKKLSLKNEGNYHDKRKELQKNTYSLLSWFCDTSYICKLCAAIIFNIQLTESLLKRLP